MDPNTQELVMGAAGASGGAPIYIEDVFSTYLYTGNGSTQTITNGIDLSGKGGLVWIKSRSVAQDHALYDTARGASNRLYSNSTIQQITDSGVDQFYSNGFRIGSSSSANASADNYSSWTFRKAAKFFDVVTYTGNNTLGRTITHNLGSVPGCIIVKQLDAANDWVVYHRANTAEPATDFLVLNSTAATVDDINRWNDTPPTSTVFTVGDSTRVNGAGNTYVAYLFAHDAGGFGDSGNDNVISCGSYTGNGSNNGPTINLGWEPQWLMFKRTDTTLSDGWWFMFDNMRGVPVGGNTATLGANRSDGEFSVVPTVDFTSTGFKLTFGQANVNASGGTFIYIAIRRGPMKTPTDATKVFSASAAVDNSGVVINTGFPVDLMSYMLRTGNVNNALTFDRLRGGSKLLATSSTNAEISSSVNFDRSDSIQVNVGGSQNSIYWSFRRAPGFFDVVAYTGTGSARTVSHNLGVAPELIIVKSRSRAGEFWPVYHNGLGAMDVSYLFLNQDFAKAVYGSSTSYFSSTAPTNSVFGLGTDASVNFNTATYIAYLFATCPGVSKVGSYTGSGTTKQIDCGFTNGARFVLIKRTDSTGNWYVWDTARGIVSGNDPYLLLNSTAAEVTNTDYIDPLSSGFEISSTAPAAINANGGSYIFLAIA